MKKWIFYRSVVLFFLCFFMVFSCAFAADKAQLTAKLQAILDDAIHDSDTPGAVLLVSSPEVGNIIVASGYANLAKKTPMQIDNNFRIASMSKTFLAVTAMKLIADGKLNLDDKAADYLPDDIDVSQIPNGEDVTIRQLLQMRSGIPNYLEYNAYSDKVENEPDHNWIPLDGIKLVYGDDANFVAGKSYEYSNTNYILLQAIIEKMTGKPIAVQFRKDIFSPLDLKHTYVEMQENRTGGFHGLMTNGYELQNKKVINVTTVNDGLGLADGGIISTVQDVATFVQALLQTKSLLPSDKLSEMQKTFGEEHYGLGIYQETVDGELAWTHSGSSAGFSGQYDYFPKLKLTIVLLTNITSSDIRDDVVEKTVKLLKD